MELLGQSPNKKVKSSINGDDDALNGPCVLGDETEDDVDDSQDQSGSIHTGEDDYSDDEVVDEVDDEL